MQALSAHFDVSETRATPDGPVRTRLYHKFGLLIRESIHLPPEEQPGVEEPRREAEQTEVPKAHLNGHSIELLDLAQAVFPPATPQPVRSPPSRIAPIRESLEELQAMLSIDAPPAEEGEEEEERAADVAVVEPAFEPLERPPLSVYAVLSNRRIALIGFPESLMEILHYGFADQFSQVTILDWSQFDPTNPELADQELVILRLELDEDGRRLDALASMDKPTLIAGDREHLVQLNPEFAGTPFDFVGYPCCPLEVVWRGANLLARADARAEAHANAQIMPVAQVPPPPEESPVTTCVLIADDDPATATLLVTVLSSQGLECLVAQNGQDALEIARSGRVGASILEIGLPGLDGFQILAELKRDPDLAKLRSIFLTARQSEADILRAFGLGADDYITKPFSPMEVAARIKRLLQRDR